MNSFDYCIKKDALLSGVKIGEYIIVSPNVTKGFNFGYVVFIPNEIDSETTLIVEGANTINNSLDLESGNKDMLESALDDTPPIYSIASKMKLPILIPLFPRILIDNKVLYAHMLSREALKIEDGIFKRIDNQLILMFNDAKDRFKQNGILLSEKLVIDGFSASAKFANRFTILHPEMVKLCIGGGISGWLTLPLKEINGEKLMYPIGVGDVDFNQEKYEQFLKVKQFYFMGLKETNDPFVSSDKDASLPRYPDLISKEEMEQLYRILGKDMTTIRWQASQKYYKALGVNAQFETYNEFGHIPDPATDKIIELLIEMKEEKKYN